MCSWPPEEDWPALAIGDEGDYPLLDRDHELVGISSLAVAKWTSSGIAVAAFNKKAYFVVAAAWLAATSSAGAQEPEFQVRAPPPGFSWVFTPGTATALLRPDGWFLKTDTADDTIASFITRENLQERGEFVTGLTFNFVRGISKKNKTSAIKYAVAFVNTAGRTKDVLLEPWGNELAPGLLGVGIRYRELRGDTAVVIQNYLIADDAGDSVRFFIFESPESDWDAMWKLGETMMKGQIAQ
jgi:hypothetical protein